MSTNPESGTTNRIRRFMIWGAVACLIIAIAAIFLPAYCDYTPRAKVSEAFLAIGTGKPQINEYYRIHKRLPRDAVEARLSPDSGGYVRELTYDGTKGELRGVIQNIPELNGRTLVVKAEPRGEQLVWTCFGEDVPDEFLPRSCRR